MDKSIWDIDQCTKVIKFRKLAITWNIFWKINTHLNLIKFDDIEKNIVSFKLLCEVLSFVKKFTIFLYHEGENSENFLTG